MSNLNLWQFTGRLGQDADIKSGKSGSFLTYSVALDRSYYDREKKQMIDRVQWVRCLQNLKDPRKLADYLRKGSIVTVSGVPNTSPYIDKEGNAQGGLFVNVKQVNIEFSTKPKKDAQPSQSGYEDSDDLPF